MLLSSEHLACRNAGNITAYYTNNTDSHTLDVNKVLLAMRSNIECAGMFDARLVYGPKTERNEE